MTAPTGTLQTYTVNTNREDLQNFIYNISPTDCPLLAHLSETEASSTKHEWSTDSLAAAASNSQIEGDDYAASTITPPTRVFNYTQISAQAISVSGTQRAMDTAGMDDMLDYALVKRGKTLKRDVEFNLIGVNQGYFAGAATKPRLLRAWDSWISTNVNMNNVTTTVQGATAAATTAGANAGAATAGRTDASSVRDLSETYVKDVLEKVFTEGGDPSLMMVGPYNKQVVSGFTGRAQGRQAVSVDTINAAAEIYVSDFGEIRVVASRFMRERDCHIIDPEYASVAYLRRMQEQDLAKTGDSDRKFITVEYTLAMLNEGAHGSVFDIATQS